MSLVGAMIPGEDASHDAALLALQLKPLLKGSSPDDFSTRMTFALENHIRVPYVNTVDNLADFFTKALSTKNFYRMRDLIMNVSLAQNGGVPSASVGVPSSTGGQYSPIGSPTGGC